MTDTIFVQFYTNFYHGTELQLFNGFSETLELCKQYGDVIWMEEQGLQKAPIDKGTIYVSAVSMPMIEKARRWSLEHRDLKIVVGGPIALYESNMTELEPPKSSKNFFVTGKSVEEYFGVPNFSYPWKLETDGLNKNVENIKFVYRLNSDCYWSKCSFCDMNYLRCNRNRPFDKLNKFEFLDVKWDGLKTVRFGTPGITPELIKHYLPTIPKRDDFLYETFIRCGRNEAQALQYAYDRGLPHKINFVLGIEFASDRMLKQLNKGFTVEEILDMVRVITDHNGFIRTSFITNIPGVTEDDLKQARYFTNELRKIKPNMELCFFDLACKYGTPSWEQYEPDKYHNEGTKHLWYYPKLTNKEIELHTAIRKVIASGRDMKKHLMKFGE